MAARPGAAKLSRGSYRVNPGGSRVGRNTRPTDRRHSACAFDRQRRYSSVHRDCRGSSIRRYTVGKSAESNSRTHTFQDCLALYGQPWRQQLRRKRF